MRTVYEQATANARQIERQIRRGSDKIVVVSKFGAVAKVLWPLKTAATIAAIGGKDPRTGERWLSGEYEPPGIVLAAVLTEITKRS